LSPWFGIAVLRDRGRKAPPCEALFPILPQCTLEPITFCALFSSPSRLTPKVEVLLDFLDEYLGTDRDPRPKDGLAKRAFYRQNGCANLGASSVPGQLAVSNVGRQYLFSEAIGRHPHSKLSENA
jgi:hypothetical protein